MSGIDYLGLFELVVPETIIVVTALAVLFVDLGIMRSEPLSYRRAIGTAITVLGCLIAILALLILQPQGRVLDGALVVDPLARLVKVALVVLTLLTALISLGSEFTRHLGEYFALLLLAATGMMLMVSTEEILMIFVSLELTSLSLYVLTALNKQSLRSAEAALKYFLFGSMAAAFMLFGFSLLYGMAGSTNLSVIAVALQAQEMSALLAAALSMVVIGMGFKVAAVPFHLWAPDAYEGAPTPVAAFIASGSKVAAVYLFAKLLMIGFGGLEGSLGKDYVPGWWPVLAFLAVVSMVLGNLAAIAQSRFKRLLAYSAIAHAGYMLLGLMAIAGPLGDRAMAALVYYVMTYGLTVAGAFGLASLLERRGWDGSIQGLAGLSRGSPLLSGCLAVFILSLAGIPPLAGFFGKFNLFTMAVAADPRGLSLVWLVLLALGASVVSLYYYLRVLKAAYVLPLPPGEEDGFRVIWTDATTLVVVAIAVVILGVFPNLLLGPLADAITLAGS